MTAEQLARNILIRMGEIESEYVTKSRYRKLKEGEQDEPPDGDTYNYLWNAVMDEVCAALPDWTNKQITAALGELPDEE